MPGGASSHLAVVDQAKNNLKKLETYITTGMDNTIDIALDFIEHDKDKSGPFVTELKQVMLDYVKMEQNLKDFVNSVDDVKKQQSDGNTDAPLEEMLDKTLQEKQANQQDFTKHEKFVDMETKLKELLGGDGNMEPPMGQAPTQIDDDVAMTQQDIVTKCPYTGKEMQNPMKNRLCGHNYEQEGIEKYIKQRKGKAKCPFSGCINEKPIDPSDLEENRELKRYIENKNRQNRRGPKK